MRTAELATSMRRDTAPSRSSCRRFRPRLLRSPSPLPHERHGAGDGVRQGGCAGRKETNSRDRPSCLRRRRRANAREDLSGSSPFLLHYSAAQRGCAGCLRARRPPRRWRRRCPSEDGATCQRVFALRGGSATPPAVRGALETLPGCGKPLR